MRRIPLLLFLAAALALNAASQSGRRITNPASATPPAPIQPPLTPEPEVARTGPPPLTEMLSVPDSIWERQIKAVENNDNFRLADFQGKVVVINLWASWCGPCRREVPEYEKVRKAYVDREVVFIGLTTEDPRYESERVKRFAREVNFGFRLGYADREIARTLMGGSRAIPQTLVINANGRIVGHWDGYASGRSGDQLKKAIEQALIRD